MSLTIKSSSPKDTEKIGQSIGALLKGGEVIVLKSDLGGGKTTLVSGIVKGAGSQDAVASPSFTISRLYETPKLNLYHFDFYRLNEPGLMANDISELLDDERAVLIIEWSDIIKPLLPDKQLGIEIVPISEEGRELVIDYPDDLAYLTEKL